MFVEEYLAELRRERFQPRAIVAYLRQVFGRARDHMVANPGAVRSIWSVALLFFVAAFVAAAVMAVVYDRALAYTFFLNTALWIAVPFTVVTLYVGALRDRDGYMQSAVPPATALTLLRIAMVPGIALFLVDRHLVLALASYACAALTDVADGWVARRWNQITMLGTVLDPLVDVVFNLALFAGLTFAGLAPWWMFALAGLRYGVLVCGGIWMYLFVGPVRIRPTVFGRLTGVFISALAGLLILLHVLPSPAASALLPLTTIALGVLLGCTVAHVVALGWYNLKVMTGQARQQGRVVGDVRWGAQ